MQRDSAGAVIVRMRHPAQYPGTCVFGPEEHGKTTDMNVFHLNSLSQSPVGERDLALFIVSQKGSYHPFGKL